MSQYDEPASYDDPQLPPVRGPRLRESRGTTVLVLGILGLLVCFVCGIIAWSMGAGDLREMRAGRMDRRQESETRIGMILGIISTALAGLAILFFILVFAGLFSLGTAIVHESRPGGFFDDMRNEMQRVEARAELAQIAASIDAYETRNGKLPTALSELAQRSDSVPVRLSADSLRDPWNHEYAPQGTTRYRLHSMGPDGQDGTSDDIAHEKPER